MNRDKDIDFVINATLFYGLLITLKIDNKYLDFLKFIGIGFGIIFNIIKWIREKELSKK